MPSGDNPADHLFAARSVSQRPAGGSCRGDATFTVLWLQILPCSIRQVISGTPERNERALLVSLVLGLSRAEKN